MIRVSVEQREHASTVNGSLSLLVSLFSILLLSAFPVVAGDDALSHPSIREVMLMVKSLVGNDVIVERVRRIEDVPTLDADEIATLIRKGVPDKVLLELARRKEAITPCAIPPRKVDRRTVLEHPSVRKLLDQVDADVASTEILELVDELQEVPGLDGAALIMLRRKGLSNQVLLALIRKEEIPVGCDPVRAELLDSLSQAGSPALVSQDNTRDLATEPRSRRTSRKEVAETDRPTFAVEDGGGQDGVESTGTGHIRVIAKSSLPVTYLEVLLDGDSVLREGKIPAAEAEPGWRLARPLVLDLKQGVVFESEWPGGMHEVQTVFALTRIVETDWSAVVKAHGQRYDTTKVGPTGEDGTLPVCEIREGWTCVVLARLVKRGDDYVVVSESKMQPRSAKDQGP